MLRTLYLQNDWWKIIKRPINIDAFPTKNMIKDCFIKAISNFSNYTQEKWTQINKELEDAYQEQWLVDHHQEIDGGYQIVEVHGVPTRINDPIDYPKESVENMLGYIGFNNINEFIESVGL